MAKAKLWKRSLLLLASALLLVNICFCGITYAKYSNTTELQATFTVGGMGGCYTQTGGFICTEDKNFTGNNYDYRYRAEYNFRFMNYSGNTIGASGYTPNMQVTCSALDVYWSEVAQLVVYKYSGSTLADLNTNVTNNVYEQVSYTSVETGSQTNIFNLTTSIMVSGTNYELYICKLVIPHFQDTSGDGPDMNIKVLINP